MTCEGLLVATLDLSGPEQGGATPRLQDLELSLLGGLPGWRNVFFSSLHTNCPPAPGTWPWGEAGAAGIPLAHVWESCVHAGTCTHAAYATHAHTHAPWAPRLPHRRPVASDRSQAVSGPFPWQPRALGGAALSRPQPLRSTPGPTGTSREGLSAERKAMASAVWVLAPGGSRLQAPAWTRADRPQDTVPCRTWPPGPQLLGQAEVSPARVVG